MTWAYATDHTAGVEQGTVNATLVLSPSWSVGVGNLLVLGITSWDGGGPVASYGVADNKGNLWTQAATEVPLAGGYARYDVWYAVVGAGKGGTGVEVTITPIVSVYITGVVSEFSCAGTPTLVDSKTFKMNTQTSFTTGSVTVTGNCLLVGWCAADTTIPDAGSGFTIPPGGSLNTSVGENGFLEYQLNVTSSAAVTAGDGATTKTAGLIGASFAEGGSSSPTTATLTGPTSGTVGVASTNFTITLDQPAEAGGVACVIEDSVGGDTITPA